MSAKPVLTWGPITDHDLGTRALSIDGTEFGTYNQCIDDSSVLSIHEVLMLLAERGVIEYTGDEM